MTLFDRFERAFMPNYGVPPVALARGEGTRVWDVDGKEYLDLIGGLAVTSLGHAHPALVEAVSTQVATLAHTSNLFLHEPEVKLAERLLELLEHPGRVFLANSGTEANEAALKLAIKYGKTTGRTYVVSTEMSFHGRTLGALSLTGKPSIRDQFGPFPADVRFVPYGDADALAKAVDENCAAVFLEPTQGEAGVVPPPDGYFAAAREIATRTGALLVADEIQSAIGRTGHWFAHQADGVLPDILTLAKGLGGGLPIGAVVGFGDAGTIFATGEHGSTFGGNPVACAAALAVLDNVDLAHVRVVAQRLRDGLESIAHPLLKGVRGRGLWLATVLTEDRAAQVQAAAQRAGLLVNAVQPDAVRLAPPLVITPAEIDAFLAAYPAILTEAQNG
ncbi:acetylornithine aminotransferase [Acrocarpospora pleiomorpha]|uniref:Acetylornithine aminotransferase n=1 Tax=Acrocarpospora pleiomorpha TaxID=90975 RepID=A0A5M3XLX1_9ACTN|nr:acetylornithine transaminase [Acrocarpospora pleiomorpha]GES21726.1 acetylornithine aminotransferase [Acrocarpospora pleiomorpha]